MPRITVKVSPGAKEDKVIGTDSKGVLKVRVSAPPEDGKANKALIEVLSKHFKLPKRCFVIESGLTSRLKVISIDPE